VLPSLKETGAPAPTTDLKESKENGISNEDNKINAKGLHKRQKTQYNFNHNPSQANKRIDEEKEEIRNNTSNSNMETQVI
jgi:hypothetical protein